MPQSDDSWNAAEVAKVLAEVTELNTSVSQLAEILDELEGTFIARYDHVEAQLQMVPAVLRFRGNRQWKHFARQACEGAGYTIANVADRAD